MSAPLPIPTSVCRHCCDPARRVNRPRGLCWRCFHAPGVRDLHPHQRQVHNDPPAAGRPPPASPTEAEPGSEAKILVLTARASLGQHLHHPGDRQASPRVPGWRRTFEVRGRRPLQALGLVGDPDGAGLEE